MSEPSIEDVAQRFDVVYTHLTGLQRRLIAAARDGLDDASAQELARQAAEIVAAVTCAQRAGARIAPSARELEAHALRARVLVAPIDGVMVMAAARAQARPYAFALLAEVIADDDAIEAWGDWTARDVLSAPRGMGQAIVNRLVGHLPIATDEPLNALAAPARARLADALREWADALPADVSRPAGAPKPPEDGTGAAADILARWVDPVGTPSDPVRRAAREASLRDGWPPDAVDTARVLVEFTQTQLMSQLVADFDKILLGEPTHEDLIAALRAEERGYDEAWRLHDDHEDPEAEDALAAKWALRAHVASLQALRKASEQLDTPREQWRGPSPLTHARTAARRCGEILSLFTEQVVELLDDLPPAAC